MRSSTAYLAGAGTVVIAIAAGLGGGLVIADIMSPHAKQEPSKVERRAVPDPALSATRDPLVPAPYLAATQAASSGPVVVSPAPPSEAGNSSRQAAQTPDVQAHDAQASTMTASNEATPPSDTAKRASPTLKSSPVQPATLRETSAPDDADAKVRDADMKRAERKKSERRQQWSDRRRAQPNREQEPRDVEQQVRASTEALVYNARSYDERPVRAEAPQIRLFGGTDD